MMFLGDNEGKRMVGRVEWWWEAVRLCEEMLEESTIIASNGLHYLFTFLLYVGGDPAMSSKS